MASFKKTQTKKLPRLNQKATADNVYWRKFSFPTTVKEFGPIDYVDVMPGEPHFIAVSCSSRVQIYNPITHIVQKSLTRFKEAAYGGSFRSDGKLICAGTEEGQVKLYNVATKSLLRIFKGHDRPAHRAKFLADNTHLASFSDDKTVAYWDIPSETKLQVFGGHQDYVRAGFVSCSNPSLILSGSYDHCVRLFDTRSSSDGPSFKMDHGAPVEDVLMFPGDGVFISVGGTEMRVWDALSGGKLLGCISRHHKTITSVRLASGGRRLLTGGLDRHVNIYDVQSYKVVHSLTYPSPILSLGITPEDDTLVVGMSDGLISMQHRADTVANAETSAPVPRPRYSYRLQVRAGYHLAPGDVQVKLEAEEKKSRHDHFLRQFQHSKALDAVLLPYVTKRQPGTTVAVMQELLRRGALRAAVAGRDGKSLASILNFLVRYIDEPAFTPILADVTDTLLDVYESTTLSPEVDSLFLKLKERIARELDYADHLLRLQGALHILLSAAQARDYNKEQGQVTGQNRNTGVEGMVPSESAVALANPVYNLA